MINDQPFEFKLFLWLGTFRSNNVVVKIAPCVLFIAGRQRRGARGVNDKDVTPPLLAKVQGNLEVTLN